MDQPLLSDLCAICHTEKPKYRCPRCRGRTCSLNCYKRHQQRASCSGKRDPATYVKKAQLATPAGIDQDYNYLKTVERNINDGSQNILHRGVGVETFHKSKVANRGWQPNSAFQKYLIENRISIQHAPKGMSREKSNNTRVTKGGNLVWTIEWIEIAGKRDVQHDCLGTKSISELHAALQAQKSKLEKRRFNVEKSETNQRKPKRKRIHALQDHATTENGDQAEQFLRQAEDEEAPQLFELDNAEELKDSSAFEFQNDASSRENTSTKTQLDAMSDASPPPVHFILENEPIKEPSRPASDMEIPSHEQAIPETNLEKSHIYYYLLKPGTIGASRVLIPLDPGTSLTGCLRDQVLQEYPTIYVLSHAPARLPRGFMLREEYESSANGKINNVSNDAADLTTDSRGNTKNPPLGGDVQNPAANLDPGGILEMLKRDITL